MLLSTPGKCNFYQRNSRYAATYIARNPTEFFLFVQPLCPLDCINRIKPWPIGYNAILIHNLVVRDQGLPRRSCLGCGFRAQAFWKQCLCYQNRPLNSCYNVFFSLLVLLLNTHTPIPKNHSLSGTSLYYLLYNYPFQPDFIYKETIPRNNHPGLCQERLLEVFLHPCLYRIWEYLNSGYEAGDASKICQRHSKLSKFK